MPTMRRTLLSAAVLCLAAVSLAAATSSFDSTSFLLDAGKHHPTIPSPQPGPPVDDGHGHKIYYDGYPRLASMVGWISVATWIVVSMDQIILCYKEKSGEGLSLAFLAIWLVGDLTNVLGAFWQGLLPTIIVLGAYYTICDLILIFQVFWYRRRRALHPELYAYESIPSDGSAVLPAATNSSRRPILVSGESEPLLSSFSAHAPLEAEPSAKSKRIKDLTGYLGAVVLVVLVGIIAWYLSKDVPAGRREEIWDTKAQVLGWISAFLYLGSRLPQIFKNMETKCQGLSLLMFFFSVCGNLTYVGSILLTSISAQHLMINASWLVGSAGTIGLDCIVLCQFAYYSAARRRQAKIFEDDSRRLDEDDE